MVMTRGNSVMMHAPRRSWMARVAASLEEFKDRLVLHFICHAQGLDAGDLGSGDADDTDWELTDGGGNWIHSEQRLIAFVRDSSRRSFMSMGGDRKCGLDAALTIQRAFRVQRREYKTADDDCEVHDGELGVPEKRETFRHISQVLTVLRFTLTVKRLAHERRARSARVIQRCWWRHCQFKKSFSSRVAPANAPETPRNARKRSTSFGSKAASAHDLEVRSGEHDACSVHLLQRNALFHISASCTAPSPSSSSDDTAFSSAAAFEHNAARVLQSAWRCVVAKRHALALRRLCVYEETSRSVMPTIRSQMTLVRQRLQELQSREVSTIDFDDEWL